MERTSRQKAAYNLKLVRARLARASVAAAKLHTEWPGQRTPEWDTYISAQNRQVAAQQQVSNLTKLLAREDAQERFSCRRVGFDSYGDLILDGEWIAVLDGGSDELCVPCAAKLLISGDLDANDVHACYAYIQEPGSAIYCEQCKALIDAGCYTYAIVEVPEDYSLDLDDPCEWTDEPRVEDAYEDQAIEQARDLAASEGARYQVRYLYWDDPSNNHIVWDSADPDPEQQLAS